MALPAILPTTSAAVNSKSLVTLHPEVERFVDMVYKEAGEKRETYLSVTLDALHPNHIQKARKTLIDINFAQHNTPMIIPQLVQAYYSLIPTKLPARIDKDAVIKNFVANLAEQEERLDQLEAAVASYQAQTQQVDPESPLKALGGVILKPLDQSSTAFGQIAEYIEKTSGESRSIKSILQVKIPNERAAFEANTFGKHNVISLFHGTRNGVLQHIMRMGLIVPRMAANGRRFGSGIYTADMARRSLNYTGGGTGVRTLLVCDVAVGNPFYMDGEDSSLRQAPAGHHVVWGKAAWSGLDEIIAYRPEQVSIRALVTL